MKYTPALALLLAVSAAACGPRIKPVKPIMDNGQVIPSQADERIARARMQGEMERDRLAEQRGEAAAQAIGTCVGTICDAVTRGEMMVGMNHSQVLAVTRTTADAWDVRGDARATVMTPRTMNGGPHDVVGEVVSVAMQDGVVRGYTYREPQGFRTVNTVAGATAAGRSAAQADALLRQGDDFALAGDLARALDRYDRADILRPNHPETTLRIATTLDKSLRPIEAVLRYRMFIHQMELERIRVQGEAAARIAEAITRAQERIIVLERRG